MMTLLAVPLVVLGMQGIPDRLSGRVSPEIAALVSDLGTAAAVRGLPIDPLIQKAIEGSAKGVPAERVATAIRLVAEQLDTAAGALRTGGVTGDTVAIAAGAFAITAGMTGSDVAELARSGAAAPRSEVIIALRVAGTLVALGVPPAETVALVSATLQNGGLSGELLALPGRVQAQVARGAKPAQAAAGLARAAAAQGRRGPPPGRPQPPPHPAPPPHP